MDRSSILNAAKETLLTAATVPTTFFVDCKGCPLAHLIMVRCPCGQCDGAITPPHCFMAGRRMAGELHWKLNTIQEMGMVAIEKQSNKEVLVVAFCDTAAKPEPTSVLHRIEIRRSQAGIALFDHEKPTTETPKLLLWFFNGVMTSAATPLEVMAILASLEVKH